MSNRLFTDERVADIRQLAADGRPLYRIARDLGVARVVIENIVKGKTYTTPAVQQRNPPKHTPQLDGMRKVRAFALPPVPAPVPMHDPNDGRSYPFPKKQRFA